jgi:hypothetical protein
LYIINSVFRRDLDFKLYIDYISSFILPVIIGRNSFENIVNGCMLLTVNVLFCSCKLYKYIRVIYTYECSKLQAISSFACEDEKRENVSLIKQ